VGKPDVDKSVDHGIERDVARVEAKLQQYFLDPQILCRGGKYAIQYGARIQTTGAVHVGLTKSAGGGPMAAIKA
jgi:hypothetical protein